MKIVIAGSRKFTDKYAVWEYIEKHISREDVIISGGAAGVDTWAEEYAREYNYPFEIFYPDWDQYGKKAGPLRNEKMVQIADKIVVFWDGSSRGTYSTIQYALRYKKDLTVIFE